MTLPSSPPSIRRAPLSRKALTAALRWSPAALLLVLAGCLPPQASFDIGLGTSRVSGVLTLEDRAAAPGGPLIVAFKYHHQFVAQGDGRALLRPTAHVLRPGRQGSYSIDVPADVVTMDVLFIAPEHLTQVFHFRRQLGVGDIRYRARLQAMPDWRSHYYTYLSPQLENLITEPRYRLAPSELQLLADWLQEQNARLASHQKESGLDRASLDARAPVARATGIPADVVSRDQRRIVPPKFAAR